MRALFLELNEFNFEILDQAGKELGLKNIAHLTQMHRSDTWTDDTYESDFLEPWVQWVSVHTRMPSKEQGIKHLGDVSQLKTAQLWETLSDQGISSGIWGAMNATRNEAKKCLFFLPDLWTAGEKGYPEELNVLLDPLRETSKNYTNRPKSAYLKDLVAFLQLFQKKKLLGKFTKESLKLIKDAIVYRFKPFVFVSFTDLVSTSLFLKYKKEYNPEFSLLFLNSLAHLQHHQWKNKSPPLEHGFRVIDQILGSLFESLDKEDLFIATNAFSQTNTSEEKPWILYRQIDHKKFLKAIGIVKVHVEPHMTHDAHLIFESAKEAHQAKTILEKIHIEKSPLFLVESYSDAPKKLFYRIQFTDELPKEAQIEVDGKKFRFFDLFTPIVRRTGKHVPFGTLLSNHPLFSKKLPNHEIGNQILNFFKQTRDYGIRK